MFPGFFTFPETLWNVVKRGEKESREYPAEDEENGAENLCHGADKNSRAHRRKETRSDTATFIVVIKE